LTYRPHRPQKRASPIYPDVCIPPAPPDLNCGDISHRRFRVLEPDPHGFDRDNDGIGGFKKRKPAILSTVRIGGKLLDLDEAVAVLSPGSGYVKKDIKTFSVSLKR